MKELKIYISSSLLKYNILTLKRVSCFCILCQNSFDSFSRSDRDCWFFNNDFEAFSFRSNSSSTSFNIFQISSTSLSDTISFRWCVYTYKNKISTFYMTFSVFPELLILYRLNYDYGQRYVTFNVENACGNIPIDIRREK